MQMLYNSDSFAVVLFDVAEAEPGNPVNPVSPANPAQLTQLTKLTKLTKLTHGGYEIVDKFARKEIFLQGAMAESFKVGVEALIETRPSEEEIDDYIERFASLMQQPVVLH